MDAALASAAKVVTAEYYSPHLAHATMEPPAATARRADGRWEIWTSVQSPGGARDDVAERLGVDQKDVVLHTTLLGGGFGRKSKWDFAIEAWSCAIAISWRANDTELGAAEFRLSLCGWSERRSCVAPKRDGFSSNRHHALARCWRMISSEILYSFFGITL